MAGTARCGRVAARVSCAGNDSATSAHSPSNGAWPGVARTRGAAYGCARRDMHFRLLGPLEVSNGDDPVRIGAGRQREVLVALLLHRNEVVSNERMIDALWGERFPPTASKVVQNTVGQLRRALDDRSGQRLQTRGHGYVLRVASGELDIDRFEALVKDGGRALADGRPAEAADRVRKALVLWRGPPLEDVAYETFAQPEIARLEELFAVALERRIDAELALGADADLVPELEALVARHPLRERLRAQLMLALYRCGRQAEALAAFREARRVLIEEVGVEPGGDLRALHEAILRQEPGLELERPALPSALDASRAPPLVGRDGEMRWLREQWQRACAGASTLVAVTGQTGVGKTRLASELAGEVFRSGALVLDACAPEAASALAQAIGGVGAGRPWLLVFDDVQADRRAWPRRDALPPGRGLLLVTAETPEQLTGLGVAATLPLGP